MPDKGFVVDFPKCTGCRLCELACALHHKMGANPRKAMIQVVRLQAEAEVACIPVKCMHCEKAPCEAACPTRAISTHPVNGARVIDAKKCIGCSACVYVCPFGAAVVDREQGRAFICDLCGGDPMCVRFCPFNVLQYVKNDEASSVLKRARIDRFINYSSL